MPAVARCTWQVEGFEPQWLLEQQLVEAERDLKLQELVNAKVAELCRFSTTVRRALRIVAPYEVADEALKAPIPDDCAAGARAQM